MMSEKEQKGRKEGLETSSEWKSFLFLSEESSYLQFYIEQNVIQSHIVYMLSWYCIRQAA